MEIVYIAQRDDGIICMVSRSAERVMTLVDRLNEGAKDHKFYYEPHIVTDGNGLITIKEA